MRGGGGGGGMRGGGGRGGPRGGGGATLAEAGTATGAVGEEPAAPTIKPREMSDLDKAKKLQAFKTLYGPTTIVEEKNWDGTLVEYVKFAHGGKQVKMPVGMVYDAEDPKSLEGYFEIYVR